ncbi:MAG: single-stranded DNA-binding protein [Candidatus Dependentiae bacterium]|nr:single-stranded DNA-binding protein [Candidatus Dependentiae bacterium]
MASYNRVVMVGNLTRDPEHKQLASGQAVCRLGLASNRQFKNRQTDSMVQEVCYIDVDVWGAQAESCRQYLSKGRSILVEGRLKLDSWEDQNGQKRSKHSIVADRIVFLSSGAEAGASASEDNEQADGGSTSQLDANIERELLGQIDQIKKRAKTAGAVKAKETPARSAGSSRDTGEIDFKDEPPFQDDLPF